ncbi:MAG: tRNA (adenosine(37)-N6)-threonylcarbamoyltransferase complex dimerization subunit type 1 TsaB [Bacillota bacterium]|nr:tRNA (adenosine(37)-N6)-threonylcarbamoyltransferase complex dimerization subunit type 1 TsaB [Bacillota bacterium]
MYILAIETTGAFASAALMKDDKILDCIHGNDRFSHLQNLMPQIETVIKRNKLSLGDMTAIAVSCGPGSFTGIRIGVSTARALSQVLGIPCIAVSSLEGLAMNLLLMERADPGLLLCPILDARRSQIYGGGYVLKDGYPEEKIKAGAYTIEEFLSKAEGYHRILLLGDGVDACKEKIETIRPEGTETAPERIRYQDAASVAKLGARLLREGKTCGYEDLKPQYMRMAEAERKLQEKQRKQQKG